MKNLCVRGSMCLKIRSKGRSRNLTHFGTPFLPKWMEEVLQLARIVGQVFENQWASLQELEELKVSGTTEDEVIGTLPLLL